MKITVPDPCPIKWNSMTPSGEGRYCTSCEKVVVDFSKFSDEEIKDYFLKQEIRNTCGSFYKHQLSDNKTTKAESIVLGWRERAGQIRNGMTRMAAVFVLGSLLTLMGCYRRHGGAPAYGSKQHFSSPKMQKSQHI